MKILIIDEPTLFPYKDSTLKYFHDSMIESEDPSRIMFQSYSAAVLSDHRLFEEGQNPFFAQIKGIKRCALNIPLLILFSNKSAAYDQSALQRSLVVGADDAMILPIDKLELNARLYALIRRYHGHCESTIHVGPLSLNIETNDFRINNHPVHLTPSHTALLKILMLNKNKVVEKSKILDIMSKDTVETRIVDVQLAKLRPILPYPNMIKTVWSQGIMLSE